MTAIKVKNWCSFTKNYFAKTSKSYKNFKNLPSKILWIWTLIFFKCSSISIFSTTKILSTKYWIVDAPEWPDTNVECRPVYEWEVFQFSASTSWSSGILVERSTLIRQSENQRQTFKDLLHGCQLAFLEIDCKIIWLFSGILSMQPRCIANCTFKATDNIFRDYIKQMIISESIWKFTVWYFTLSCVTKLVFKLKIESPEANLSFPNPWNTLYQSGRAASRLGKSWTDTKDQKFHLAKSDPKDESTHFCDQRSRLFETLQIIFR